MSTKLNTGLYKVVYSDRTVKHVPNKLYARTMLLYENYIPIDNEASTAIDWVHMYDPTRTASIIEITVTTSVAASNDWQFRHKPTQKVRFTEYLLGINKK